jgi:hypothetical protein
MSGAVSMASYRDGAGMFTRTSISESREPVGVAVNIQAKMHDRRPPHRSRRSGRRVPVNLSMDHAIDHSPISIRLIETREVVLRE